MHMYECHTQLDCYEISNMNIKLVLNTLMLMLYLDYSADPEAERIVQIQVAGDFHQNEPGSCTLHDSDDVGQAWDKLQLQLYLIF